VTIGDSLSSVEVAETSPVVARDDGPTTGAVCGFEGFVVATMVGSDGTGGAGMRRSDTTDTGGLGAASGERWIILAIGGLLGVGGDLCSVTRLCGADGCGKRMVVDDDASESSANARSERICRWSPRGPRASDANGAGIAEDAVDPGAPTAGPTGSAIIAEDGGRRGINSAAFVDCMSPSTNRTDVGQAAS
jgi:hypothetical protein